LLLAFVLDFFGNFVSGGGGRVFLQRGVDLLDELRATVKLSRPVLQTKLLPAHRASNRYGFCILAVAKRALVPDYLVLRLALQLACNSLVLLALVAGDVLVTSAEHLVAVAAGEGEEVELVAR